MGNFCIAMNMRNHSLTQYHGFAFNSMTNTSEGAYGAKSTGLFSLGFELDDNGVSISAFGTLFDVDMGSYNTKHLRYITLGLEGDSPAEVTVVMDKKVSESLTYTLPAGDGLSILSRGDCSSFHYGRFVGFTIKNVSGGRFANNYFDTTIVVRNANIR